MELIRFIHKNIVQLNLMMERAGMSEMDGYSQAPNPSFLACPINSSCVLR